MNLFDDPALAARDRITRAPKAFGFVDLKPTINLTKVGEMLLSEKRLMKPLRDSYSNFNCLLPYHTHLKKVEFGVKPYLELKVHFLRPRLTVSFPINTPFSTIELLKKLLLFARILNITKAVVKCMLMNVL